MIELKNVNKYYVGDTFKIHALKNVSLEIKDGEYLSVMGRSGSGKSTLLNIIGFLDNITDGSFVFNGEDVSKLKPSGLFKWRKENIGFVFQNFALINHCTVYENTIIPLEAIGVRKKEMKERAEALLEKLKIEDLRKKYPGQISGGQKQRVAIARALIARPKLILADEPTGALDGRTADELMGIFDEIHDEGTTIVLVTHDKKIAERTERIVVIDEGEIVN